MIAMQGLNISLQLGGISVHSDLKSRSVYRESPVQLPEVDIAKETPSCAPGMNARHKKTGCAAGVHPYAQEPCGLHDAQFFDVCLWVAGTAHCRR